MSENLNLGSLNLSINLNTQSLNRVIPSLDKLEIVVNKLAVSIDKMAAKMDTGYTKAANSIVKSNEKISSSSKTTVKSFKNIDASTFKANEAMKKFEASVGHLAGKDKLIIKMARATEWHNKMLKKDNLTIKQSLRINRAYQASVNKVKNTIQKGSKEVTGWKSKMQSASKSVTLALGPLNRYSAKLNALTGLFSANNIALAASFAGFTAFVVLMFKATTAGALYEQQMLMMDSTLKAFGNQTNLTAEDLNKISVSLAEATLTSTKFAREAATALVTYKGVTADAVEPTLNLAQSMSQVMGGGLLDWTKKLGRLYSDPIKGLESLGRAGEDYNKTQKDEIRLMVDRGNKMKATEKIIAGLNKRFSGEGKAAAKGLSGAYDTLGERFTHFFEEVGSAAGKITPLAQALNNVSDTLKRYTDDTVAAQRASEVIGGVIMGVAHTVEFLFTWFDKIASLVIGTLITKAIVPLTMRLYTAATATKVLGVATAKTSKIMALFNAIVGKNPLVFLAKTAITAGIALATYFTLFKGKAEEATIAVAELNAELTKTDKINMAADLTSNLEKSIRTHKVLLEKAQKDAVRLSVNYDLEAADFPVEKLIRKEQRVIEALEQQLAKMYARVAKGIAIEERDKGFSDMVNAIVKLSSTYNSLAANTAKYKEELKTITNNTNVLGSLSDRQLKTFLKNTNYSVAAFRTMMGDMVSAAEASNPMKKLQKDISNFTISLMKPSLQFEAFLEGGKEGLIAFDEAFKQAADQRKFEKMLQGISSMEITSRSSVLDIDIGGKSQKDSIQAIADEYVRLSRASRQANSDMADMKEVKSSWSDVGSFIVGQITDIINQMQALYEEQAAMYGKLAQDALDSSRSTAQFYMELADAVRYSNNAQAQSYEDRAMAAAKAGAAEYAANKKLQDQANAAAKKNFENQKMLQKGQIIMNTANAIMKGFSDFGWVTGSYLATIMGALGETQLSLVDQQTYSPKQFGGRVVKGQPYKVGEVGEEAFIPDQNGTIIPNNELDGFGDSSGGGGTVVNFNITTNDSAGFEALLMRSRGTITNIIKSAQNESMGSF